MRIYLNKIKIIWIGSKTISSFHSKWKFKIVHTNFYPLVMKFVINLDDMIHVHNKNVIKNRNNHN